MGVAFALMLLAFIAVAAIIARIRPAYPEPGSFLRGMYRYEPDLGWPHGVQEDDGERAWRSAPGRPAAADADGEVGLAATDADPIEPVPVVRVRRS